LKFDRSVWVFLLIGVALRCVAINQPLVDAHLIRQCQTAAVTKNLIAEPGFHLSSKIPWLGDLDARYVLELPLYNYLVVGVCKVVGDLNISGKLTTILLWAASFLCLQFIWRRLLDSRAAFWANLLFVISPLSLFFGQAFMPEMLVQLLAFGFVCQAFRYDEKPSLDRWFFTAALGLAALLIKLPETAHLYIILGVFVFQREGWKALIRPRYLLAAAVTLLAIKGWSSYMDAVNAAHVPEWTSRENMHQFVGTFADRFQVKPWLMLILYIGALIIPGPALFASGYGLYVFMRREGKKLLGFWMIALAVFYVGWLGNAGPAGQSYYNLPALAPLCALFGIGMRDMLAKKWILSWQRVAAFCAVVLVVLPAVPVWKYLFKQDRQLLAASLWAKENTKSGDVILFRINHRPDMIDYRNNPVPGYYSERPTFIWTGTLSAIVAQQALARSRYAVVTLPQSSARNSLAIINRFRGASARQPESMDWLEQNGFHRVMKQSGYEIFKAE
jgi:4-amino-4-deoxy-L-arabinose transferase-like glycosyltransferase